MRHLKESFFLDESINKGRTAKVFLTKFALEILLILLWAAWLTYC